MARSTKCTPPEVRERAVRMARDQTGEHGSQWAAIEPDTDRALGAVFERVPDQFRSRDLLTFYPPVGARAGWHTLEVS
jgi:hypothetical protein